MLTAKISINKIAHGIADEIVAKIAYVKGPEDIKFHGPCIKYFLPPVKVYTHFDNFKCVKLKLA